MVVGASRGHKVVTAGQGAEAPALVRCVPAVQSLDAGEPDADQVPNRPFELRRRQGQAERVRQYRNAA